ncbi:polyisoprenoid-binding protein [Trinickia fusca]|uniref:Polyisoprenoid-binding protein n=2 Tax=Trinickia fusca TaxID=2419777 RepID=A0A494XD23_9BURK|nr:polyisoprenoid-binding protein [Trinickia fusca]
MRATMARTITLAALAAGLASMPACVPVRVVTHTVSANEAAVPVGHYTLDPHHWSVTFNVEHLKYTRLDMRFDRAHATLDWQPGGLDASAVDATIDAGSVDTNDVLLDKIVKGPDLFDAATNPTIRFVGTQFARTGPAQGKLEGNLTIRGTTRPVTLDVTFNGYGANPLTKEDTLGFSAQGHFSRAQFGLATWFPAVGDEVRVRIEAEFVRHVNSSATDTTETPSAPEAASGAQAPQ